MKVCGNPKFLLLIILAFALLLRLFFYIGEGFTDDNEYVMTANYAAHGHPIAMDFLQSKSNGQIRIMSILPVALCFKVFGFRISSASIYFFFCSLSSIVLTYLIATHLFGTQIGLLSAFLYSFFPLDAFYSTQVDGDIAVPFYLLCGLYLLLKGSSFLAGIFWGLAVAAKENGIFFFPVLLSYFLAQVDWKIHFLQGWNKRAFFEFFQSIWKVIKEPLSGFLLVFYLELLLFYWVTGDLFYRFKIVHWTTSHVSTETSLSYYPKIIFDLFPPHNGLLGLFPIVLPFLFWIGYRKSNTLRKKNIMFFLLWVILLAFYHEFGVMTLSFRPMEKWIRYWTILVAPVVIITAYGLSKLKKQFCYLFLTLLLLHSLWALNLSVSATKRGLADILEEYRILHALPPKPTYAERELSGRLYTLFEGERIFIDYEEIKLPQDLSNCYIIVQPNLLNDLRFREHVPSILFNIPQRWKLIATVDPLNDRRQAKESKNQIYYIPKNK